MYKPIHRYTHTHKKEILEEKRKHWIIGTEYDISDYQKFDRISRFIQSRKTIQKGYKEHVGTFLITRNNKWKM